MWKRLLAFSFVFTLIILLDPTTTPAQPDFGKGRGKWDRGSGSLPGGFSGAPSFPGGFTPPGGPSSFGPPGGRSFGGGPPGPPGRGMDPEFGWRMLQGLTGSTGDTVDLSKIPPDRRTFLKGMIERRGGIMYPESGVWTKADYLAHQAKNEEARAAFAAKSGGSPGGPPGDPNSFGRDRSTWGQGNWGGPGGWDQNGSGWGQRPGFEKKETEEERPVAMRYGKLPKGLPGWYDENDTDKDGQVSLYEWRKAGMDVKEFQEMDLNGDGLVTADEYLRFARQKNIDTKVAAYEAGERGPGDWGLGEKLDQGDGKGEPRGKGFGRRSGGGGSKGGDNPKGDWGGKGGDRGDRPGRGEKKGNPWKKE